MKHKKNILIILTLSLSFVIQLKAQEWKVPDKKKAKLATFKFTEDNSKLGESLFITNCKACHGVPGKKNFANMLPSPGDPATDDFQEQTDGEIFYKVTVGRTPMPSFKNTLSENDRWNIISFLRKFKSDYVQQIAKKGEDVLEYMIDLKVQTIGTSNKVKVTATALSKNSQVPEIIKGADVTLYAKRKFGILQLDKRKSTNSKGEVIFDFPRNLPGDSLGVVEAHIKLNDEIGDFGEAETTIYLPIGRPTITKSLIDTRAMWSVRSQAPIWIILIFNLAVFTVAGFVIYVLLLVTKIRKLGISYELENNKVTK